VCCYRYSIFNYHHMNNIRSCTCQSPPIIDLTDVLTVGADETNQKLMRSTLAHWGWCHVSVNPSSLPCSFKRRSFVKFFEDDEIKLLLRQHGAIFRGRSAESGSSSSKQPEPKQSWEVQRCSNGSSTPLHKYMNVLHSIAVAITKLLSLPENTLLQEGPCTCNCQGDCTKCNIDLMRVFLYDPVHPTLGSSPHTDWGSWTVVWQDLSGGLQTYCSEHDLYVDVIPPQGDSKVFFIVHVGDVTSLALAHASKGGARISFPSPMHRVVCPSSTTPRVSLVYFAYPPPRISLLEIEGALENHAVLVDSEIRYDSYFLLQNQTTGASLEDSEAVYRRIRTQRLCNVLRAKWDQVQR
jgi:2OG-Fe(II) oxygenase superfamily